MSARALSATLGLALVCCSRAMPGGVGASAGSSPVSSAIGPPLVAGSSDAPAPPLSASAASTIRAPDAAPVIDRRAAASLLYPTRDDAHVALSRCENDAGQVECLLRGRYATDPSALVIALALYARTGDVAGVEHAQRFDGGYRGIVEIDPVLAVDRDRRHLDWVASGLTDIDAFLRELAARSARPPHYRDTSLALRFFRTRKGTTPNAYASDWSIAYNVAGSINTSAERVRETLFHELFHLNDDDHGQWSRRALAKDFDAIVARCGVSKACLKPYAPSETTVRRGTYYAFQPGNGVHEYGAELALRYYREQRAALRGERAPTMPFKCGPRENASSWASLVEEFFSGFDVVPPCAPR